MARKRGNVTLGATKVSASADSVTASARVSTPLVAGLASASMTLVGAEPFEGLTGLTPDATAKYWFVNRVLVPNAARGLGIGTQLLSAAIKHARKLNPARVIVTPGGYGSKIKDLNRFYVNCGFKRIQMGLYLWSPPEPKASRKRTKVDPFKVQPSKTRWTYSEVKLKFILGDKTYSQGEVRTLLDYIDHQKQEIGRLQPKPRRKKSRDPSLCPDHNNSHPCELCAT